MMRNIALVCAIVLLAIGVPAQNKPVTPANATPETKTEAAARPTAKPAKSQVAGDLRVTIVRIKRTKEWKDKLLPIGGTANPGHEFVVAEVRFEALKTIRNEHNGISGLELEDADGNWYACGFKAVGNDSSSFLQELPFHVPEGVKLKTLRIEGVAFDLQPVPAAKPQR